MLAAAPRLRFTMKKSVMGCLHVGTSAVQIDPMDDRKVLRRILVDSLSAILSDDGMGVSHCTKIHKSGKLQMHESKMHYNTYLSRSATWCFYPCASGTMDDAENPTHRSQTELSA